MLKKLIRKMYISILTCVLVLCTTITTTYAWLGSLPYSNVGKFSLAVDFEQGDYSLKISADGENFYESLTDVQVKRAVLIGTGNYTESELVSDDTVLTKFDEMRKEFDAVTTDINPLTNTLTSFTDVAGNVMTEDFVKFDIYLKAENEIEVAEGSTPDTTTPLDVYFSNTEIITGVVSSYNLSENFVFGEDCEYDVLKNTQFKRVTIDTANAARLAITKYNSVSTEEVDKVYNPTKTTIYTPGNDEPSYDATTKVYNLGGMLLKKSNLALSYFNKKFGKNYEIPSNMLRANNPNYKDQYLNCNNVISSTTDNFTIESIIKLTVYFWFEGWDADCLDAVLTKEVTIELSFTSVNHLL